MSTIFFLNFLITLTGYCYALEASEKNLTESLDSVRFQALLKSGYQYLLKPGEKQSDMQRAMKYANEALQVSISSQKANWQGDTYLLQAMICKERRENAEWSRLLEKALVIYRKTGNDLGVGNALMEKRFQYEDLLNDLDRRMEVVNQAIIAYRKAKAKKEEADARRELGDLLQGIDKFPAALIELKKSLSLYHSVGFKDLHGVYDLLGHVYSLMGVVDESVKYGLLAEKTAITQQDSSMMLCTIYHRLGYTYYLASDFRKAYEYQKKALGVAVRHNDDYTISFIAVNLANILTNERYPNYKGGIEYALSILKSYPNIHANSKVTLYAILINSYNSLKMHDEAERYFRAMLNLRTLEKWSQNTINVMNGTAAKHCLATKQIDKAEKYIIAHRKAVDETSMKHLLAANYLWSFKLDSLKGNYLSALTHYQSHKALKDSLQSKAKEDQIAMLNIRFETERKDNELKMKAQNIDQLTRQTALQNQLLKEAQRNRNVTFALLILLILCLVLLYSRYKIRQKINIATSDHNRTLQKMVKEREWLIRELHHRVKNNLQTVTSLLESQSVFLKGDALHALKESQHRVQAMSLIHQKLYLADNLAMVNMAGYVRDLVEYLKDSFDFTDLQLDLEIDPIDLDVSLAVPIGLILNEAITNSVKYAFPELQHGIIKVQLKQQDDRHVFLAIMDNGVGFPDEYLKGKTGSLGIILIRGLAGELGGDLKIINNDGTKVTIQLKPEHDFSRVGSIC